MINLHNKFEVSKMGWFEVVKESLEVTENSIIR